MQQSGRKYLRAMAAALFMSVAFGPAAAVADTINIGLSSGAGNLDPVRSNSGPDLELTRQIFDTLVVRDPDTGRYEPHLATSWELLNDTTWRLHLRQGVNFHNGEPFNAEAAKFSIERYVDPSLKSPHAGILGFIDRVEVVDEFTIDVVTKAPYPVFLAHLSPGATGMILMLPPNYVNEKGDETFAKQPIGTGPFKLADWVDGSHVALKANEDYWKGAPRIDDVVFRFVPENSTRVSALLAGDLDVIETVPVDLIPLIEKSSTASTVVSETGGLVVMMQLNPASHPALADKRVRKAMNHAVDIDTIIEALLGGQAARRAVPVDPSVIGARQDLPTFAYDPELARKLLAEAGYPDGFEIDALTSNGRYTADYPIAQAFAEYLAEVGIKVNLSTMEWARLVGQMAQRQGGPMYQIGWSFREGDVFKLKAALHPEASYSTFKNKEFGDLIDEAEVTMDAEKRNALWGRAQEILIEEVPFVHSWQPYVIYGVSNRLDWSGPYMPMSAVDMSLK